MKIYRGFIPLFIAFAGLLLTAANALAAVVDYSSFNSITNTMVSFLTDVDAVMSAVFANSDIAGFVYREWAFFTVFLISWWAFDSWARGFSMRDLVSVVLIIGMTRVLLNYYDSLTNAFWQWSVDFAEGIQMAAVGNTDLFFLPSYIFNICSSLSFSFSDVSWLTSSVTVILAVGLGSVFTIFLGIIAVFTASWAIWGYAIAKMIGWMFVPTLMFERLAWLFDGWMRLFFGFLIYNVIARANLILVALVFKGMTGASNITPGGGSQVQMFVDGIQDVAGLFCFLLIGLLGLLSTGKFATTIAGGATGSGGGSLVRAAVMFATKGLK